MKIIVAGATGATGRLLVTELLRRGHSVAAIVRSRELLLEKVGDHDRLSVIQAEISELGVDETAGILRECDAVASCLGHNLSLKGMYGKPRLLVAGAVQLLCEAIRKNADVRPVKFVLMNTTANRNRDLSEKISIGHRIVVGLLRVLLPPQRDNEKAAEYLRTRIGQNDPDIQWSAVRPDGLIDEDEAGGVDAHPSPIRDPVFNAGSTSRINVAVFMADLIEDDALWAEWKGRMPVIYNIQKPKGQ